ncbi:hypothetical protein [Kordiimonas sp.]|uniref:hypothetical protein n=1 Tax=Kordiimonas sp. TaxID=1970157 RepID=UPI003A8E0D56
MFVASSVSSLWNYKREGISEESVLKRYALLYDTIIFNRHGCAIGDGGFPDIAKNVAEMVSLLICSKGSFEDRKALGRNKRFQDLFVDCWEVVDNPEQFEREKYSVVDRQLGERLGNFCHREIRTQNGLEETSQAYDIDDVKELVGDLYADLGLNALLQKEGLELVPSFSPIIGRALEHELTQSNFPCHELFQEGLLLPDFDKFSWDELLELRTDRHIKSFREFVFGHALGAEKGLDKALMDQLQTDLWALAEDVRPNPSKTLLSGIVSNLPSPVGVNPFGLLAAGKDYYDQRNLDKKYGHVFFMQKLKTVR